MLDCELCKVLEWQPDRESFLLRAGVGWREGLVGRATVGAGRKSQAGYTLLSDKPVIVDDFRTETRFTGPPLLHEHRVLSGASVVIPGADGPYGVLGAHTRCLRHFNVDDVHFLTSTANVLADFIQRQRVESQAEHEAAFSTTLLESLPGMVIVTDREGRLRRWNRALETLSGYSADELEGRPAVDLVPADERRFMSERFREVFEHGGAAAEGHIQSKDGRRTPCLFSGRALVTDRPYLIGIAIDITERRALEAQLRQAQKMEAFGQLAGGIAHDFNNILTIILGTCEGLFDALPPQERLRADVKTIADAARRAASMTQQLLAFSRRAIVEPKIVNLSAAVADVGKMIERLIGEDVRLHRELAQDLWPVRVDPGLFTQLLVNLAVNARDAMPAGGSLTVQTRNADLRRPLAGATVPPGRYVVLTVTDTGTGIPPEIRERIFEPFFTTKPVGQGSGLGLAVVDGIVRQSGGQVDVWSEPGRGTSFAIYFPAVDIPVPPPDVGATPDLAGAPRGTETILLVEDEPGVRRLARMVLERLGYRVVEAPNGEAALRRVDTHDEPIDLLVTDVVMPGIDGRQLAEQLRRRCAGLQTLFLSGYTDDAIVRRGIIQDEVAFLRKPFSAAELAGKVRDLLDRAARRPRRGHLS